MREIKSFLREKNISEEEIIKILSEESKLIAIKILKEKTNLPLLNAKDLLESIQYNDTHFEREGFEKAVNREIKLINANGKISVFLKEGNQKKNITPADAEWEMIKKTLGTNSTLNYYEKQYCKKLQYVSEKKQFIYP